MSSTVLSYLLFVATVFTLFMKSECIDRNRERSVVPRVVTYQRDLMSFSNMIHKVPSHLTLRRSNEVDDSRKSKKSQGKKSKFQSVQQRKPKEIPTRGRMFSKSVRGRYHSSGPCIVGQRKDKLGICREIW